MRTTSVFLSYAFAIFWCSSFLSSSLNQHSQVINKVCSYDLNLRHLEAELCSHHLAEVSKADMQHRHKLAKLVQLATTTKITQLSFISRFNTL
jgi:hypothetical protein